MAERVNPNIHENSYDENSYDPWIGSDGGIRALMESMTIDPNDITSLEGHGREEVMRFFLSGMGNLVSTNNIVAMHHIVSKSKAKIGRLQIFTQKAGTTLARRGNLNMRNGWFGSSHEVMTDIVLNGFDATNGLTLRGPLGTGVYLSPQNLACNCAQSCFPDENGLKYMIMCRVILGNTEVVPSGSFDRFLPKSIEFDCAVDHPAFPSMYMVWSCNLLTHIHPDCIVVFRENQTILTDYIPTLDDNVLQDQSIAISPPESSESMVGEDIGKSETQKTEEEVKINKNTTDKNPSPTSIIKPKPKIRFVFTTIPQPEEKSP
ncbi:hypothetical protein ZOSMA_30G00480 [Zostera marina]|uniref:PARP catalytic domain-containing protein n=1 Tax=Zostera marina TaxID=29655 RepID=A0A0K9PBZ8_ZOSMR|nr:hypothetical protein ZOSMA_30G00480 [Zostera marina]